MPISRFRTAAISSAPIVLFLLPEDGYAADGCSEVLEEVKTLALRGYKEVVLTGIHLSSYGVDFKENPETLLTLIQAVHEVEGVDAYPSGITGASGLLLKNLRKV